jgi:hypothetical protein
VKKREAYLWLCVSREAGISAAAFEMQTLESWMGITETEKAKNQARELQARVRRSLNAKGCTGWEAELDATRSLPPIDIQRDCD